jgi:zinc protease
MAPLAADEDASTTKADAAFWRALFGEHPHARVVRTSDVDKLTRSDVEAWLGRVHASRNAVLVVVGDVEPSEVERAAKILSAQIKSPSWVADLAAPPAVVPRPAAAERVVPVVTSRPGTLTDIRLACLLPPMSAADAGHYDLLKHVIQGRLNEALRFEHGDTYGVNVEVDKLRGGTTYLVASTFVSGEHLAHAVGALRAQWQRWARAGFDTAELNVARWRYAGTLPFRDASEQALASRVLSDWSASPEALVEGARELSVSPDVGALRGARVNELFATCKSNAVLGLTGSEPFIEHALEQAWPALATRGHTAP